MCCLLDALGDTRLASSYPILVLLSVVALFSVASKILPFPVVGPIPDLGLVLGILVKSANPLLVLETRAVLVASIDFPRFYGYILFFVVIYARIFLWFFSLSSLSGGCW
jgi:hypothetical protein